VGAFFKASGGGGTGLAAKGRTPMISSETNAACQESQAPFELALLRCRQPLVLQQSLQLTGLVHFLHNIRAADELALHV